MVSFGRFSVLCTEVVSVMLEIADSCGTIILVIKGLRVKISAGIDISDVVRNASG